MNKEGNKDIRDQVSVYFTSRNGTNIGLIFQDDPLMHWKEYVKPWQSSL